MLRSLSVIFLSSILTVSAFAHGDIKQTIPAAESTVATMPDEITLEFSREIRLTKVYAECDHGKTNLDISGVKSFVTKAVLPFGDLMLTPATADMGRHTVTWQGLGKDGHVVKGSFFFDVQSNTSDHHKS